MGPDLITIRNATLGDLDIIVGLLTAVDLPTEDVGSSTLASFVVAELDGTVVGVAGLENYGNYGLLRSVAVAPVQRNKGIAKKLTHATLERAAVGRIGEVYLLTTTADKYFTRHGFLPVERIEVPDEIKSTAEFSSLCPDSAVVMRLKISS